MDDAKKWHEDLSKRLDKLEEILAKMLADQRRKDADKGNK